MSMLKVIVASAAILVATPVAAQVADGWYTADDSVSLSPKPSCGRMPRDGEYVPLFRLEGGVYTACQWSYQGPKKRVSWGSTFGACALYPGYYQDCLRYGPGSAPYQVPGRPPTRGFRYQCNRDGSFCGNFPRY